MAATYCLSVYECEGETLVACCDTAILGETFCEGGLELRVSESFYGNDECDEARVLDAVGSASIANLAGNGIVERAIDQGLIDEDSVIRIAGVKHAQMVTC